MQAKPAPGVVVESLLTKPADVLRTGVPVFLGLVRMRDLEAYNARVAGADRIALKTLADQRVWLARKRMVNYFDAPPQRPLRETLQVSDPAVKFRSLYLATFQDKEIDRSDDKPAVFGAWPQFQATYGDLNSAGYLDYAVRGYFENGGRVCYVQIICYAEGAIFNAVSLGLETLEPFNDYDLVCVPDLMALLSDGYAAADVVLLQTLVLRHCGVLANRMAILDSLPQATPAEVESHSQKLSAIDGALYYPWIRVFDGPAARKQLVPPCGHVAGVYARSDVRVGVHKAPANELLEGVYDLERILRADEQGPLNDASVNCLRAFPRRGIRVWGARTLSVEPDWRYVNVRRVFLTAVRWIERNMSAVVFETHTPELWSRIERALTVYFTHLLERGAFAGRRAEEAFYVKCDAETNPPELRESGTVVTEIGIAPVWPAEFIVVRIIHGPSGAYIAGPPAR